MLRGKSFAKLLEWLKNKFLRKKSPQIEVDKTPTIVYEVERKRPRPIYIPRRPRKAIHQDIGKFMKGSRRQHKWYRRSTKQKKKPEEDN